MSWQAGLSPKRASIGLMIEEGRSTSVRVELSDTAGAREETHSVGNVWPGILNDEMTELIRRVWLRASINADENPTSLGLRRKMVRFVMVKLCWRASITATACEDSKFSKRVSEITFER